jgi:hypothetical protein
MNASSPQIVPLFATHFGVLPLANAADLNPALATLFAARATEAGRDAGGKHAANTFVSRDDLTQWPEEPVREALRGILAGVRAMARAVSELDESQFAALRTDARAWFTIVHPEGSVPARGYANSSWFALYCVCSPEPSRARLDSGVLRIHELRPGPMFQDAADSALRVPYRRGHYTWRPVPGQMALFRAALTHEIALVRSGGPLVLISTRVRLLASDRSWMPSW